MEQQPQTQRWKCTVAYDGTDFEGWQSQPSGNTIQDLLEARFSTLLKTSITVQGSGRTDAGVHARGQVFHTDLDWDHPPDALIRALNTGLPHSIRILSAQKTEPSHEFHARFSATRKRYTYHISLGDPSPFEARYVHALHGSHFSLKDAQEAAKHLIGTHDFTPFAARREGGVPIPDGVRTLYRLDFEQNTPQQLTLTAEGNGFLYKMVRSLAGSLIQVGLGRLNAGDILSILNGKERTHAVPTAPAQGLFLDCVYYSTESK